jgi:hypothetical protein
MRTKRVDHGGHMDTAKLTTAACASYAANATLGFAVATKVVDTSKAKWLHHGLYISTFALTGAVVWTAVGPLVLSARSALTKKPRGVIAGRESAASLPPVRIPSKNARKVNSGGLAGWFLLPTLVPLAVISKVDARTPLHPVIALTAAPFYLAAGIAAGVSAARRRKDAKKPKRGSGSKGRKR